MTTQTHLVLGGARSGKSHFAEDLAQQLARPASEIVYVATGEAIDAEMASRIALHQNRRGEQWRTVEAPLELAAAVRSETHPGCTVLVDCLSVWLGNLFHHDKDIDVAVADLLECLPPDNATLILVASETGLGIVPENALARAFRDRAGRLNQQVAAVSSDVTLVVAGLPVPVKSSA